jgi:hypothetical protein
MKPENVQEDKLWRGFAAGFTIENIETIDVDILEQHVLALRRLELSILCRR